MDSKETRKQHQNQQPLSPYSVATQQPLMHGIRTRSYSRNATYQTMHPRPTVGVLSLRQPQQQPLGLDGSSSSSVAATQQPSMQVGNQKRRRGRPRKYAYLSDANAKPPAKRGRGRCQGSGNKKKKPDALGAAAERSLTAHTINVNAGEDIATKVAAFISSQEAREVCILSATGVIAFALLQVNYPRGVLKCEGRYNIVSMSGSFLNTENNGTVTKDGSLKVCIVGPNGRVLGGAVVGMLVARSPVQVVAGSFVRERVNVENNPQPASATEESPQSQSQGPPPSSESSEGNGSKSP